MQACSTTPINNPCPSYPDTKCVVYSGLPLTNIGATTNERLNSILSKINTKLGQIGGLLNFEFPLVNTSNTVSWEGTTTNVPEGTNLYFTNARSRSSINLTTDGTSGPSTYDPLTGNLNIPNYQGGGSNTPFTRDITVSLSGGKTLGRVLNGQVIPCFTNNFSVQEMFEYIAIESVFPTYTLATLVLSQNQTQNGEVGETLSNVLTATYTQNDAGTLTAIRITRNGSDLTPNGGTSPFSKTNSVTRILGNITYQAFCNGNAGALKPVPPGNLPDSRTPIFGNPNAPQAAFTNFASNQVLISGFYRIFYGAVATQPTNSAGVRALSLNRLTNQGNTFTLPTGTTFNIFCLALPPGKTLLSVKDANNFEISTFFVSSAITVNDAGGNPISYTLYTYTNSIPYNPSQNLLITTN
jgi:hypothetical protein